MIESKNITMLYTRVKKFFQNVKKEFFAKSVLVSPTYHALKKQGKPDIDKNPLAMVSYKYAKFYSEVVYNSKKRNKKINFIKFNYEIY